MRDLVLVVGLDGQRMGQDLPATRDGPLDSVGDPARSDALEDQRDDLVPALSGLEGLVDRLVREDDDAVLEEGHEEQDARTPGGPAEPLLLERVESGALGSLLELDVREEEPADLIDPAEQVARHEGGELESEDLEDQPLDG